MLIYDLQRFDTEKKVLKACIYASALSQSASVSNQAFTETVMWNSSPLFNCTFMLKFSSC